MNTSEAAKSLLPNEPRLLDWDAQQAATCRFLLPKLAELKTLFFGIRTCLDPQLQRAQPVKNGKPFPLGQCLEISRAVMNHLQQGDARALDGSAADGYAALSTFLTQGGRMRPVWGDLRGEYFQNAFLMGTLYVDVANDTVVTSKAKVEILPFAESGLIPIKDFVHYIRLACRYWQCRVFPNHILPAIAPFLPLITAMPGVGIQFHSITDYMIALTMRSRFHLSESVLDGSPMNNDLFQTLSQCLGDSPTPVASGPIQGQAAALLNCRKYRDEGWHLSNEQRAAAMITARDANHRLAHLILQ